MDIINYKKLYKRIADIVNKIDPCFYNGPNDEYDFQINGVIKLIESHQADDKNKFLKLFFGERKNITNEELEKIKQVMDKINSNQIKK